MEEFIQLRWFYAVQGCLFFDETFSKHIGGHFHCGYAVSLANSRLEHPEAVVLYSELNVLHIGIMFFQVDPNTVQFIVNPGHFLLQGRQIFILFCATPFIDGVWCANTSHHIFPLGVR